MIKLLIVEDSAQVRSQLTALFDDDLDVEICHAHSGMEALKSSRDFRPDVVIMGIGITPEMDFLTALLLRTGAWPARVVMLSSFTDKFSPQAFDQSDFDLLNYIPKADGTISLAIGGIWHELLAMVRGNTCHHSCAH